MTIQMRKEERGKRGKAFMCPSAREETFTSHVICAGDITQQQGRESLPPAACTNNMHAALTTTPRPL